MKMGERRKEQKFEKKKKRKFFLVSIEVRTLESQAKPLTTEILVNTKWMNRMKY